MDVKPLLQENFYHHKNIFARGEIFASGKLSRWKKNLCLWNVYLMEEKSLPLENFLDEGKLFVCGKK